MNPEHLTILITGATDGLGERVAHDLAQQGATLLLHGRFPEKGRRLLAKLRETTGNDRLHYYNADFSYGCRRACATAPAGSIGETKII